MKKFSTTLAAAAFGIAMILTFAPAKADVCTTQETSRKAAESLQALLGLSSLLEKKYKDCEALLQSEAKKHVSRYLQSNFITATPAFAESKAKQLSRHIEK